jgi:hypothetical protein
LPRKAYQDVFWALSASTAFAESTPKCSPTPLATVKAETLPDGRIKIPIIVENHHNRCAGASQGVGACGRTSPQKRFGVAGSIRNFYIVGGGFSVGQLQIKDLPIYLDSRILSGTDGTVAPDVLRDYNVDIDFPDESVRVFSQDDCFGAGSPLGAGQFQHYTDEYLSKQTYPVSYESRRHERNGDVGHGPNFILDQREGCH